MYLFLSVFIQKRVEEIRKISWIISYIDRLLMYGYASSVQGSVGLSVLSKDFFCQTVTKQ